MSEQKMTQMIHIHPDEIEKSLGKHEYEIVLFTTTWCGPCKLLKQKGFPAMFKKYGAKDLVVYVVDGDECSKKFGSSNPKNPMRQFQIRGYPTCLIYRNGKLIDKNIEKDADRDSAIVGYADVVWFMTAVDKIFA